MISLTSSMLSHSNMLLSKIIKSRLVLLLLAFVEVLELPPMLMVVLFIELLLCEAGFLLTYDILIVFLLLFGFFLGVGLGMVVPKKELDFFIWARG